jgi:microcystin degradation protein MlrC
MSKTRTILLAGFKHETNTFSALQTGLDAYRACALYLDDDVPAKLRATKTEMAAFLDFCEQQNWRTVHPVYADATTSGKVSRTAFEFVSGKILSALKTGGPFDAILLALHGAMVCEHTDDGEGELLAAIRDLVGDTVPIAVTLDLHANVTDRMADLSDALVIYRTYPHIDQYEVATQTAELIRCTLAGEIKPTNTVVRGAMLDGADHGRTTSPGPMSEVLASAYKLLSRPGVLATGIAAGFPWADSLDTGPSVVIVGDGSDPKYRTMADGLIAEIWAKRDRTTLVTVDVATAMVMVKKMASADGPIVLADFADNPGGGGYGDATRLLKGMLDADLQDAAFATIYDPRAVQTCIDNGLGARVVVDLGGKIDPRYGESISVSGTVITVTDGSFTLDGPMISGTCINMGPTVVLRVGGLDIVITSGRFQASDHMFFRHARIEPTAKQVLAVKSAHQFRATFGPIASQIIVVDDGGGLTSQNYKDLPYCNIRRPVYPLDFD